MDRKIDRTGEEALNNFGSKIIIREYRGALDIDVYFPEYDWTFEHARYDVFKKGNIKCPYEPRIFGVGYIGEGKYKAKENGKHTDEYKIYHNMLQRCYDPKLHEKESTYEGCTVEDYLLNFQNMGEWIENNYYEIPGETMCLDKDILCKGNKIYSRETCIFVPQRINTLFTKSDNDRGKYPIGVTIHKATGKFTSQYNMFEDGKYKRKHIGLFTNIEDAFQSYKYHKELTIKKVADYYKQYIPEKVYKAMYNYEVEITD